MNSIRRNVTSTPRALACLVLGLLVLLLHAGPLFAQGRTAAENDRPFTQGDELVQLDFKDQELPVVIETIARITGRNFIYDDRVRGRVTIVSPSKVTADQAYAVFESVLKIKGFTAVPGPGGVLKIVPIRDAKESSIDTIKDDRPSANRDSFVTRLVPLLYIDAEAITNTIKPLVSKDASMVAYAPTNTIIMTDTEANIRRLLTILEAIDVETYKEELAVIKVKHADAATLGQQISEIYGAEVSSSGGNQPRRRSTRTSNRRGANQPAATPANQPGKGGVRIITDERTNSLLVLASRGSLEDIRELVRQLDVPLIGGGRIHVYYLQHADAEELASTLQAMLSGSTGSTGGPGPGRTGGSAAPAQNLRATVTALAEGITVNPDAATNSLVIQASREAYEALEKVIQKLDIARPQVLVEAMILEVDVTDGIDLGVEWTINAVNGDQEFFFSTASAAAGGSGAGEIAGVIKRSFDVDENGVPVDGATGTNFDAVLRAAAQDSNLNLVSAPHVLTSDNEEAEIRIGNNIPIITSRVQSATGNTAGLASSVNVERQDIGVTLRVTPQISEGDSLRMKIFQELTEINENLQAGVGSAEEVGVALSNRKIENTVVVKDNETVVVGGLISDIWTDAERKVPFLGDIPGLGWAFKSTSKDLRKINLIVFLTPHIIRNAEEMELETIKRRGEFSKGSGEQYEISDEDVQNRDEEDDDKWAKGNNPVLTRLRDHTERYSNERGEELEDLHRQQEYERRTERIGGSSGAAAQSWGLRVAMFQDEGAAAEALTRLLDAGYDGSLVSAESGGALVFELVVGPYLEQQAAEDAAEALSEVYDYDPTIMLLDLGTSEGQSLMEAE